MSDRWRCLRLVLAALAIPVVAALTFWPSAAALECEGVKLDDGCLFTITGGDTTDPDDGYAVTNADGVPLWDFVGERDLQAIGHPISQRWVNGPFTLQAFQKVILQWDPGKGRMNYYNTLDVLANRYPGVELPNVPPHRVLKADRGADFATIKRNHLLLLDQNPTIKERFLSEPDWLNLYGLPIRYEEREAGGHPRGLQMLRAQRTVFVIWNVPAPGTTVGRVNLQNVPDKVKKLSNVIIPDPAKSPAAQHEVAGLPVFTLPTPTPVPTPTPAPSPAQAHTPSPTPAPEPRPEWLPRWQVLIDFYDATDGPNWTNNTNWLSAAPVNEWHGVGTTRGRITRLSLADNNLSGAIPWQLGYLPDLEGLSLGKNFLQGPVPPELGRLTNLKWLGLAGNQLSGAIPPELGRLANLRTLHLTDNLVSGTIPPELGQLLNLEGLYLDENLLSGAIPPALGNLGRLKFLNFGSNQLSGTTPPELGRLANLRFLWLYDNELTGAIPAELGGLMNLGTLQLGFNRLSGPIPAELGRLTELRTLGLAENRLSGAIPPELGRLAKLQNLELRDNQLTGEIPSELGSLASLALLYLHGNALVGGIPPELGNLTQLRLLTLDQNRLSGTIPPELAQLPDLKVLDLAGGNQFTGCIPAGLRGLERSDIDELGLPFCGAT